MKQLFLIVSTIWILLCSASAYSLKLYHDVEYEDLTSSTAVEMALRSFKKDVSIGLRPYAKNQKRTRFRLLINSSLGGVAQFRIDVKRKSVDFVGSDELGVIHAMYYFSETVLGIDPLIYFTAQTPESKNFITLKRGHIEAPKPTFVHRIMFINDEDLITGFRQEKIEHGMNLEFMGALYETMLRLRMTGVIPSTLVLPDEPHLKLASDMGLYIAQHHAEPVGSVPLYWPKHIPYSWTTEKAHFIDFWKTAIERQKGKNVIWTLNFRGLLDRAFWEDDPAIDHQSTLEDKANIINDVISTQYSLIREITGNNKPLVAGYLWGELNGMYEKGLLEYPEDTIVLHSDNGFGHFKEGLEKTVDKKRAGGVYQHVSYHNRWSHIRINSIHPDVFHHEMRRALDLGLDEMIVLNVGNFKEKIFGIRQMTNYMNDFNAFSQFSDGDYYFDWYSDKYFSSRGDVVSDVYRDFFAAQLAYRWGTKHPGDESYFYIAETLLTFSYEKQGDIQALERYVSQQDRNAFTGEFSHDLLIVLRSLAYSAKQSSDRSLTSVQKAFNARSVLSTPQQPFFDSDLYYPSIKMLNLNSMLEQFTLSLSAYIKRDYRAAEQYAYQALQHAQKARDMEKKIETAFWGQFSGWYRFDHTARTWQLVEVLEHYLEHVNDLRYFNLPYSARNSKTPSLEYKYQPGFNSEYREELIYLEDAD